MSDDVIYALILGFSVIFGYFLRRFVTSPSYRRLLMTSVGVAMVTSVCRWNSVHAFVLSVCNALIVRCVGPKKCHVLSCILCFGYLAIFRSCHVLGLPAVDGHSNVVLLLMTLRLVGVAFEVHDLHSAKERSSSHCSRQEQNAINNNTRYHSATSSRPTEPQFSLLLAYSFCYIGLFTGPFYTYRTYSDMLVSGATWQQLNVWHFIRVRLQLTLPVSCAGLFLLTRFFNFQYATSDAFYNSEPLWWQVFYAVPLFVTFRLRLYLAFVLAECACISAGLGAYPVASRPRPGQGPTLQQYSDGPEVEYNFDTVHNVDVYLVEMSATMRDVIRAWNKTIQYWLTANIYRRLPLRSSTVKMTITMLVSAYWHGLYPGFYLTFLSASVYLYIEQRVIGRRHERHQQQQQPLEADCEPRSAAAAGGAGGGLEGWRQWLCWFCRMRYCEYLGIGFMYRSLDDTLRCWTQVYYWTGHVIMFIMLSASLLLQLARSRHLKST